mgnify:CR=1 FL=1|jgi:hypothetical protein
MIPLKTQDTEELSLILQLKQQEKFHLLELKLIKNFKKPKRA